MNRYEHGGAGNATGVVCDFSVNTNPLGMPEGVRRALAEQIDNFSCYPEPHSDSLITALAKHYGISGEWVVCGNGAVELLYKAVSVIRPKTALLAAPCFSEYEKALLENRCQIRYYHRAEENAFLIAEDFLDAMEGVELIILCEPNNPTGSMTDPALLQNILLKAQQAQTAVILDECFLDFVSETDYRPWQEMACRQGKSGMEMAGSEDIIDGEEVIDSEIMGGIRRASEDIEVSYSRLYGIDEAFGDRIVVIKAFTKLYAMAGLRLGYAVSCNREWMQALKNTGPCWNVSVPAQAAGLAALSQTRYVEETRRLIKTEREYLMEALLEEGYTVYPSLANFILLSVDREAGKQMEEALYREGLFIRNAANFEGLHEGFYRIAVQTHANNEKLLQILKKGAWGTWQKRS